MLGVYSQLGGSATACAIKFVFPKMRPEIKIVSFYIMKYHSGNNSTKIKQETRQGQIFYVPCCFCPDSGSLSVNEGCRLGGTKM